MPIWTKYGVLECITVQYGISSGYMGMFRLWRSPNQDGVDVFYCKRPCTLLGVPFARIGTVLLSIGGKYPSCTVV